MLEPKHIRDDDELLQLHLLGQGAIFNDYSGDVPSGLIGNVLHLASCRHVAKSNTKAPKLFFADVVDAVGWITRQRGPEGARWRRCVCCRDGRPAVRPPRLPEPIRTGEPARPASSQKSRADESDPFTEGNVENLLQPWLEARGYDVRKRVRVVNGIIDLVASGHDGEWLIEAKGEDRGGFNSAEMNFRIGIAQICSRRTGRSDQTSALAIPMTPHFCKVLRKQRDFLVFERMNIWLFVAHRDGTITQLKPSEVQSFADDLQTKA